MDFFIDNLYEMKLVDTNSKRDKYSSVECAKCNYTFKRRDIIIKYFNVEYLPNGIQRRNFKCMLSNGIVIDGILPDIKKGIAYGRRCNKYHYSTLYIFVFKDSKMEIFECFGKFCYAQIIYDIFVLRKTHINIKMWRNIIERIKKQNALFDFED